MAISDFLVIEELSFAYRTTPIFERLSFKSTSRTTVFKGSSGCGKTTLLKLLAGDLQPQSFAKMPANQESCLVIQEDSLFPWLTGFENISRFTGAMQATIKQHPMYSLVDAFMARKAYQMSYGQRRLVELFRAVIHAPQYLYIDEPFNFLDPHRMSLVVPFLKEEFLPDTILTISTHHRDEDADVMGCVFRFDGDFPVKALTQEK